MTQLFRPRDNTIFRGILISAVLLVSAAAVIAWGFVRSPWETEVGVVQEQPVPFSHKHHVKELGIDCRYCHSSVQHSAFAGLPSLQVCMSCHSQIWKNAAMLKPIRDGYAKGLLIQWNRVNRLPKYVYFNHSAHVNKGIGCTSCHGLVGEMPLTWKVAPFYMRDCLECHTHPEKYIRPQEFVFSGNWISPERKTESELDQGRKLVQDFHIPTERLRDCNICHR